MISIENCRFLICYREFFFFNEPNTFQRKSNSIEFFSRCKNDNNHIYLLIDILNIDNKTFPKITLISFDLAFNHNQLKFLKQNELS